MKGVITGRDVFRHAFTIIRCWGTPTFARCLWAVLTRRTTTFLTVIYEGERGPEGRGGGGGPPQQHPGDDHDRSGDGPLDVHRADHGGDRREDPRSGAS